MAKYNLDDVLEGLAAALEVVEKISPQAGELGIIANVAAIAQAATQIAQNILERVEEGKIVLASNDQAEIRAIIANLQAENDKLDKAIRES